jgi:myosin-18
MFKGCRQEDMPPHIFSYAQSVYKTMLTSRQDQSILLQGHSGSGKSHNSKHILNYLFKISNNSNFTESKLNAMFCLLNSFCSIRNGRNSDGSSRFLNVFLLEFNYSSQLASILAQTIQFDQTRVIYQPNNESNYLIFYNLLVGCDLVTKNELQLASVLNEDLSSQSSDSGNLLFQSCQDLRAQACTQEGIESNKRQFTMLLDAFRALCFDENETKAIFAILAAAMHLGRAGATKCAQSAANQQQSQQQRLGQFKSANDAHKAANLLGISFNQLNDCVFSLLSSSGGSSAGGNQAWVDIFDMLFIKTFFKNRVKLVIK